MQPKSGCSALTWSLRRINLETTTWESALQPTDFLAMLSEPVSDIGWVVMSLVLQVLAPSNGKMITAYVVSVLWIRSLHFPFFLRWDTSRSQCRIKSNKKKWSSSWGLGCSAFGVPVGRCLPLPAFERRREATEIDLSSMPVAFPAWTRRENDSYCAVHFVVLSSYRLMAP